MEDLPLLVEYKASEAFEHKGPDFLRVAAVIHNRWADRSMSRLQILGCFIPYDDPDGVIRHWTKGRTEKALEEAVNKGALEELELDPFGNNYRSLLT